MVDSCAGCSACTGSTAAFFVLLNTNMAFRCTILKHQWQDATCTEPKTCCLCKGTEGEARGHYGEAATYENPTLQCLLMCMISMAKITGTTLHWSDKR